MAINQDRLLLGGFLFVAVFIVIVVIWLVGRMSGISGARREAMRHFAESRSYVFLGSMQFRIDQIEERNRPGGDPGNMVEKEREVLAHDLMIYHVLFPPGGTRIFEPSGEKERVVNLVSIARGNGEQLLFDHSWVLTTQGSEGAPRRNRFGETIAAFRSGLLSDIPPFSLSSRKAHDRSIRNLSKDFKHMLEESVVPLDSPPAFSESYVLTAGKNKDAVREAIPPQFLELMQKNPGYAVSCRSGLIQCRKEWPTGLGLSAGIVPIANLDALIELNYAIACLLIGR